MARQDVQGPKHSCLKMENRPVVMSTEEEKNNSNARGEPRIIAIKTRQLGFPRMKRHPWGNLGEPLPTMECRCVMVQKFGALRRGLTYAVPQLAFGGLSANNLGLRPTASTGNALFAGASCLPHLSPATSESFKFTLTISDPSSLQPQNRLHQGQTSRYQTLNCLDSFIASPDASCFRLFPRRPAAKQPCFSPRRFLLVGIRQGPADRPSRGCACVLARYSQTRPPRGGFA
jgi:hypothetical protein